MSDNSAWWLPILEKAYAKFNVNYAQLDGGWPVHTLRHLTGMPVMMYNVQNQSFQEFFDIVNAADNLHYAITALCRESMYNLASDHAYTLLRAFKLTDGTELVKMRNPWSRENYDGPFSDSSDEWTDQRK
jgi:hypothetical protein